MATITTDTYLDEGANRTSGESWTMNGAILRVRTDTRVHARAPANMSGTVGSMFISSVLGGGIIIDSRAVRWMPYNSGSGTVPPIGTIVTQGGVSGYLLGVWPDYTSMPLPEGFPMPETGYLKFREVTGGTFSVGPLSEIGASAAKPDRQGWIEVASTSGAIVTVPRLGFYRVRGDWFELDQVTSGNANDVIQIPTNGGGTDTIVPCVWIETGYQTGQYEAYPAVEATYFTPFNLSTDERSKFVLMSSEGRVIIGSDGTNDVGYVPPAGCRIRIPSNIFRHGLSLENINPPASTSSRARFTTTAAGVIDINYALTDHFTSFSSPYRVTIRNSGLLDTLATSNSASSCLIENVAVGVYRSNAGLNATADSFGGIIRNSKFYRAAGSSNGHSCSLTDSNDFLIENCDFGVIEYTRVSGRSLSLTRCQNITVKSCFQTNAAMSISGCFGAKVLNLDHTDRYMGETNSVSGVNAVTVSGLSSDTVVDGLTFGKRGAIANQNPYLPVFTAAASINTIFRNAGTLQNPLPCSPTFPPSHAVTDTGTNNGLKAQRIYMSVVRTGTMSSTNTSRNCVYENVSGDKGSLTVSSLNTLVKGCRIGSVTTTAASAVYGSHIYDAFLNDHSGAIWATMNEPTVETERFVTLTLTDPDKGGFTSGGSVSLPNEGDQLVIETPYAILGHSNFHQFTVNGSGTTGFTYHFDIDTGNGFSGEFTPLFPIQNIRDYAPLINPKKGFRLRLLVRADVANPSSALSRLYLGTNTSLQDQANLYDLDTSKITIGGLRSNSRVQVYDMTHDTELFNAIVSGEEISFDADFYEDFTARTRVMYADETTADRFIEVFDTVTMRGMTRIMIPEVDRAYVNNGINGFAVTGISIDDSALLINVENGSYSWGEIYAYETAWLYSEEGIRDEGRFIEAIDSANYIFENFKIKNVSDPQQPLLITGGWARDSVTGLSTTLIDTSGGAIFSNPDLVIPYAVGAEATVATVQAGLTAQGLTPAVVSGVAKESSVQTAIAIAASS